MIDNKNKRISNIIVLIILGVFSILFTVLSISSLQSGFLFRNKLPILITFAVIIFSVAVAGIVFLIKKKELLYKLCLTTLIITSIVAVLFYLIIITGIFDKIRSVNELRAWVSSFGIWMPLIYIIINFLQVVILPIPGFVAVASGVALFGPNLAVLYSFIGILLGSIVAYFIGKKLGYNVVKWLVGKETIDKWLLAVKNKDRIILTFMFLFPLFPDDVLCFVAGLSSMSTSYFLIMITITRIITILVTSYSVNGNLIPYNTWWGLLIWAIVIVLTVVFTVFLYKNGDKIEKKIVGKLKKFFKKDKINEN